ncbi:cupin domain-containing protein [Halospeciosus flavus]|uniref:cupin domain-containing protein n=1 Tax=Halospeciosus flavus TaxID=3032283 RepID=UPI00361DB3C8
MPRDYDRSEIPSVYNLEEVTPFRDEPGFQQVVFRGIDQMVGFSQVTPEKEDGEPHTHPYEQMNMLVEGRLDFLVDGERVELEPYDTLAIPPRSLTPRGRSRVRRRRCWPSGPSVRTVSPGRPTRTSSPSYSDSTNARSSRSKRSGASQNGECPTPS